jgi:hypothetical protein
MPLHLGATLAQISTALLLSITALPVPVIAFAVLYHNNDSFSAGIIWLLIILPALWIATVALSARDAFRRHSPKPLMLALALLAPTVGLVTLTTTQRFFTHRLFSSTAPQPFTAYPPLIFMRKFQVCDAESRCKPHRIVTRTATFTLKKIPAQCFVQVINGTAGKHTVDVVHITLNGKRVAFDHTDSEYSAKVGLNRVNTLNVDLSGPADAYIWLIVSHS